MKPFITYLLIAAVLAGLGLFAWQWQGRRKAEKTAALYQIAEARQRHRADSLQVLQQEAAGYAKAQAAKEAADTQHATATKHYETIRRTPATAWPNDQLQRYFTEY